MQSASTSSTASKRFMFLILLGQTNLAPILIYFTIGRSGLQLPQK